MKKHKLILALVSLFFLISIGCENLKEDYNLPEYDNSIKIDVVVDVSILREKQVNMYLGVKFVSK